MASALEGFPEDLKDLIFGHLTFPAKPGNAQSVPLSVKLVSKSLAGDRPCLAYTAFPWDDLVMQMRGPDPGGRVDALREQVLRDMGRVDPWRMHHVWKVLFFIDSFRGTLDLEKISRCWEPDQVMAAIHGSLAAMHVDEAAAFVETLPPPRRIIDFHATFRDGNTAPWEITPLMAKLARHFTAVSVRVDATDSYSHIDSVCTDERHFIAHMAVAFLRMGRADLFKKLVVPEVDLMDYEITKVLLDATVERNWYAHGFELSEDACRVLVECAVSRGFDAVADLVDALPSLCVRIYDTELVDAWPTLSVQIPDTEVLVSRLMAESLHLVRDLRILDVYGRALVPYVRKAFSDRDLVCGTVPRYLFQRWKLVVTSCDTEVVRYICEDARVVFPAQLARELMNVYGYSRTLRENVELIHRYCVD